jgi:hypothetical protein
MHDYLSWPADELDPYRLAAQTQVIRVVAMVAAKVGVEARRERERNRILAEMSGGSSATTHRTRTGKKPGHGGGVVKKCGPPRKPSLIFREAYREFQS